MFLSTPSKFTLPQALAQFVDAFGVSAWNVQLSAATLTAIPSSPCSWWPSASSSGALPTRA
ncbi:MAG TPA: hypothetical protein VL738_23610 [Dactylosporangium sp.]|nr:hypothetical protein [Dactylosporangium sp.]